jgi:hypothetical protein
MAITFWRILNWQKEHDLNDEWQGKSGSVERP